MSAVARANLLIGLWWVVARTRDFFSLSQSRRAIPRAAPSSGSVPAPSSSSRTRELGLKFSSISVTCLTCALKVERLCSMLCSSPMSAKSSSMRPSTEPSAAGMGNPIHPRITQTPAVLRATVLPPVLGPVITSILNLSPQLMSIGTALSKRSGCLAFLKLKSFLEESSGIVHLSRRLFSESAYKRSMFPITFSASSIPFIFFWIFAVSSRRIFCSSYISEFLQEVNSLLILIIELASM